MTQLLLGCGSTRDKRLGLADGPQSFDDLVTCDINPAHSPDVIWDLNVTPWPWADDTFEEVHAYEILEHLGRQGDAASFFAHFTECWRILEPGGLLCVTTPAPGSPWLWGDPSHTRAIFPESLVFLQQAEYERQVGVTPMSDFRDIYSADFEVVYAEVANEGFAFILKAVK